MEAIAREEGYGRIGKVPTRLNNPGDLLFMHQSNAVAAVIVGPDDKTRTYAHFATVRDGWLALERQIRLDAQRGETLKYFINKYAPGSDDNDPASYLSEVMRQLGVKSSATLLSDVIHEEAQCSPL